MAGAIATTITVAEGAMALADLIEALARGQAAAQMLSRDIANAHAAGQTDIPDTAVDAAREWAVGRRAALEADMGGVVKTAAQLAQEAGGAKTAA